MKRFDEAAVCLRECVAVRLRTNPNEWRVFLTKLHLGMALSGLKQYEEAEHLLLEAYEGLLARRAEIPSRLEPTIRLATNELADLYDAWEKPEQARAWRQKASLDLPRVDGKAPKTGS